jgi:hypothetical protein
MKNVIRMTACALFAFGLSAFAQTDSTPATAAPDSGAAIANVGTVDSIVFATDIKDRVPVGQAKEFGQNQRKVFCWTKLTIQHAPFQFKHVWYNGEEKVLEVPLRLKFASGRLWSYKTVTPGDWRVDVVDRTGKVIGSGVFTAK